jgi:hypothetical protein
MKGRSRNIVLAVVVVLMATGVFATASFATEETKITGQVWAENWNDKDMVTAATIKTQDGQEYWIVDNAIGKEMFKLDLETVKVTGSLSKIDDGRNAITVNKYEIIQNGQKKEN